MTNKATLLALAERVEAAEAGSFTLDKEILAALGYTWRGMGYWYHDNSRQWMGSARLTASLDAAMTLVPEGWGWSVGFDTHGNRAFTGPVGSLETFIGKAATPALALCAAALRARAETLP